MIVFVCTLKIFYKMARTSRNKCVTSDHDIPKHAWLKSGVPSVFSTVVF